MNFGLRPTSLDLEFAHDCLEDSGAELTYSLEERLILATRAQAAATLALIDEQRTANLIALLTDGNDAPIPQVDYHAVVRQIITKLEIKQLIPDISQ